jgi:hypothetical protein
VAAGIEDRVVVALSDVGEARGARERGPGGRSSLKRRVASVWPSGVSLTGSMGGCPPLGEARVTVAPASRKVKYGAANSSSQKPVLRPVLPSWS